MELKSTSPQKSENKAINRIIAYDSIASKLALLSDEQLSKLLSKAKPLGTSIGGTTSLLNICDRQVFIKKIRLTDIERQNRMSTKNIFELPTYLQYAMSGNIGSTGFGAWRELAAHVMTTSWVLANECSNFPLLYHWRELPRQEHKSLTSGELQDIELSVEFWGGSESVRKRFIACAEASTELVLFLEYFPETLRVWLQRYLSVGEKSTESSLYLIEKQLESVISFMNTKGLLHFDIHCGNIMIDDNELYVTDFGLAMSTDFELSETESSFFKEHHNYDQYYATTYFVRQIVKELFKSEDREALLQEFAVGKNIQALLPEISSFLIERAPIVLRMNEFFKKIKHESKSTSYPLLELERLRTS